jgi:hypothetical protein
VVQDLDPTFRPFAAFRDRLLRIAIVICDELRVVDLNKKPGIDNRPILFV